MRKKAQEKFIKNYETRIKKYRDEYYRNIVQQGLLNQNNYTQELAYDLLPLLLAIIIILLCQFSITGVIGALVFLIICNIIIISYRKNKHIDYNNYKNELRKIGYFNIATYEEKVKQFITGPNGYYKQELNRILEENGQNENSVEKVIDNIGNQYYIWADDENDELKLVNSSLNSLPRLKKIRYAYIRYYRLDKNTQRLILKTDIEKLTFNKDSLKVFNKLIKERKFENKKSFDPAEYINDFELFMHNIKSKMEIEVYNNLENKKIAQNKLMYDLILLLLGVGLTIVAPTYKIIFRLLIIVSFILLNKNVREFLTFQNKRLKSDDEYIAYLNNDPECINEFKELKLALNIPPDTYKVYSPEGACYLTWLANGYFHVFLNLIYFNSVYMVVKIRDVEYYQVTENECLVKLKDKKLCFTKEAEKAFKKLLPNKEYSWVKGLTNINEEEFGKKHKLWYN